MQRFRTLAAVSAAALYSAHTDQGGFAAAYMQADTFLFSASAPDGQLFAEGQAHPGDGWYDHPSKIAVFATAADAAATVSADHAVALATAETQVAELTAQLAEQKGKFNENWNRLSAEADQLRETVNRLNGDVAERDTKIAALAAQVADLEEKLTAPPEPPAEPPPAGKSK